MAERALKGVQVVEYCRSIPGSYCAKMLADLGADVIKIEPPITGDEARRRGPFLNDTPDPDLSGLFLYLNTNKLGITLCLDSERACNIFRKLIAQTDILVEDQQPGEMDKLGLDYENLQKFQPGHN